VPHVAGEVPNAGSRDISVNRREPEESRQQVVWFGRRCVAHDASDDAENFHEDEGCYKRRRAVDSAEFQATYQARERVLPRVSVRQSGYGAGRFLEYPVSATEMLGNLKRGKKVPCLVRGTIIVIKYDVLLTRFQGWALRVFQFQKSVRAEPSAKLKPRARVRRTLGTGTNAARSKPGTMSRKFVRTEL
jgi:hypothetical protein